METPPDLLLSKGEHFQFALHRTYMGRLGTFGSCMAYRHAGQFGLVHDSYKHSKAMHGIGMGSCELLSGARQCYGQAGWAPLVHGS